MKAKNDTQTNEESKSYFSIERRLYVTRYQQKFIDEKLNIAEKIYNTSVKHYRKVIQLLRSDKRFKDNIKAYKIANEEEKKKLSTQLNKLINEYKLTKPDIEKYMNYQRIHSFNKSLNVDLVQSLAKDLSKSIEKAIFHKTTLHFRKKNSTNSLSAKKANSAIIYISKSELKTKYDNKFNKKKK